MKKHSFIETQDGLSLADLLWMIVILLVLFMVFIFSAGCASTSVKYGPFSYISDKDVAAQGIKWERRSPDGSMEKFSADALGGNASNVNAIQAEALKNAINVIGDTIKPVP